MTTRTQWLEARRKGLGGSDILAAAGLSRYKTPLQLWRDKIGEAPPEKRSAALNAAAERGNILEPMALRWLARVTGFAVRHNGWWLDRPDDRGEEWETNNDVVCYHPQFSEVPIRGNLDGEITARVAERVRTEQLDRYHSGWMVRGLRDEWHGQAEIKTTSYLTNAAKAARRGKLALSYAAQQTAYYSATRARWGLLVVWIGPADHNDWTPTDCRKVLLEHEPNPRAIELVEQIATDFWAFVRDRREPSYRHHKSAEQLQRALEQMRVRPCKLRP